MLQDTLTAISYYSSPGPMTEAFGYSPMLADLPREIPALVKTIQGLLFHIFWAERYGLALSEERKGEVQLRSVWKQLARLQQLDPARFLCPAHWSSAW